MNTNCNHEEIRHLIDSPYGLKGAYMVDSERFECLTCNHILENSEVEERNLKYLYKGK